MAQRDYYYQEGRQGSAAVAPAPRRSRRRIPSGFTYISGCVKYTMFFFNFLFWLSGLLLLGVGVYAALDKWSSGEAFRLKTIFDVMFNIGFLLMIIGGIGKLYYDEDSSLRVVLQCSWSALLAV